MQMANQQQPDRVAAWARSNANPGLAPQRSGSRSAPTSSYSPSSYGGGTLRRKVTRRTTSRAQSRYEEEEEGYVSGEYEDGPFELIKIRVKVGRLHILKILLDCLRLRFFSYIIRMTSAAWH